MSNSNSELKPYKEMSRDECVEIGGEFLNSIGYELNLKDWLWMEDAVIDHKYVDLCEMFVQFYEWVNTRKDKE